MIPPNILKLDKSRVSRFDDNAGVCGARNIDFITWLASNGDLSGPYCSTPCRGGPVGSPTWMALPICEEGMRAGYDRADVATVC